MFVIEKCVPFADTATLEKDNAKLRAQVAELAGALALLAESGILAERAGDGNFQQYARLSARAARAKVKEGTGT